MRRVHDDDVTDGWFDCRQAYMAQLDTVLRGKGVRVMRRLTARSKYRACQALYYLELAGSCCKSSPSSSPSSPSSSLSPVDSHVDTVDELTLFRDYLYCLSEMNEIRLSCSEESLQASMSVRIDSDCSIHRALPLPLAEEQSSSLRASSLLLADPRSLVRTWLHDEGAHCEVVELCRDVLLVCRVDDVVVWYQLLQHMVAKCQTRSLQQTLLMVHNTRFFCELSFGVQALDFMQHLSKSLSDTTERIAQVMRLLPY